MPLDAFFLPVATGRLFCLFHRPDDEANAKGAVIYVHPFAEEMNKSRRMAALQAEAMASAGYFVLRVDLLGCGDSSGELGDATWESWVENLVEAESWLRDRMGAPLWWWGLRAGCLLATEAADRIGQPCNMLMWQPVLLGKQHLQQFMRLKIAGDLLGGGAKGAMDGLKQQLAQGIPVEIAGYMLSPALALGLESAELAVPQVVRRLELIEISSNADGGASPAVSARLDKWRGAGIDARAISVAGPAFWQTTEIEECPDLIGVSLQAMGAAGGR